MALLKASDLFLFLSNIEASPLVLFEAVAAKLPFVAAPAGNAAEIAQWTKAGVIVEAQTDSKGKVHASIDDASRQLVALANHPTRRLKLGRIGRQAWEDHFTWEKITQQYLDLYFSLVNNRKQEGS